ncbi:hypothetical protein Q4S45_03205 [Massilia sp. R2A-15]|uniref:hypothetical protein n=1 Tax=Massilia sp. R2A-15 TaxID=3064278 RepID=UPI002736AC73|nr:hypothetical protein [Massilia sp. R2A-15]WLI90145.1 hypothetical protein Q4S45_03205 [Massilia sp. R2A-15]
MKIRTVAASSLWLGLTFFANTVSANDCRDALLGDFATEPNGKAGLRIEKIDGKIISRMKSNGAWMAEFNETQVISPEQLAKFFDNEELAARSCGLGVAGVGMVLKMPIGTAYEVSSPTEKSFVPKRTKSGFLAYAAQGFAVSAVDLYQVHHQGEPKPKPVALSKSP